MGRSVNYLDNAKLVLYFPFENEDNKDYQIDLAWSDLIDNLQSAIKIKLPSYDIVDNKWDNNETRIILENTFCYIGISEYCGLVSLSVAPKCFDYGYSDSKYKENFAEHHVNKIKNTLVKVLDYLGLTNLRRVGVASNGESFFEKVEPLNKNNYCEYCEKENCGCNLMK